MPGPPASPQRRRAPNHGVLQAVDAGVRAATAPESAMPNPTPPYSLPAGARNLERRSRGEDEDEAAGDAGRRAQDGPDGQCGGERAEQHGEGGRSEAQPQRPGPRGTRRELAGDEHPGQVTSQVGRRERAGYAVAHAERVLGRREERRVREAANPHGRGQGEGSIDGALGRAAGQAAALIGAVRPAPPSPRSDSGPVVSSREMVPIVYLPGAGGAAAFWNAVADRLADLGRPVRLGWPGFGDEPADPAVHSLRDLVRWTLSRMPPGASDVVAQSMGGVVAASLALKESPRTRAPIRLVLCATSGGVHVASLGQQDWRPEYRGSVLRRPGLVHRGPDRPHDPPVHARGADAGRARQSEPHLPRAAGAVPRRAHPRRDVRSCRRWQSHGGTRSPRGSGGNHPRTPRGHTVAGPGFR